MLFETRLSLGIAILAENGLVCWIYMHATSNFPLDGDIKKQEVQNTLNLRHSVERNRSLEHILNQVKDIMKDLDPIKTQLRINIRHRPRPHSPPFRRRLPQLPPAVPDSHIERPIIDAEEVRIPDPELDGEGDVDGDGVLGVDVEVVEAEADHAEARVGGPEDEDRGGDEGEDEEGEKEGDGAVAATAAGVDGEEDVGLGVLGRREERI